MTARLAMTAAAMAIALIAPQAADARTKAWSKPQAPGSSPFTPLTGHREPARSRYLPIDDLPETYGVGEQGIKVRWRINKVKVKVPFALNY